MGDEQTMKWKAGACGSECVTQVTARQGKGDRGQRTRDSVQAQGTWNGMVASLCLTPVILHGEAVVDDLFELVAFLDEDLAEAAVLAEEDGLEADELE
jgi:hypothetical protein